MLRFSGVWADNNCTAEHNGEPWDYGEETNISKLQIKAINGFFWMLMNINTRDYGETNISKLQNVDSLKL